MFTYYIKLYYNPIYNSNTEKIYVKEERLKNGCFVASKKSDFLYINLLF